jgi:hypothetical protein
MSWLSSVTLEAIHKNKQETWLLSYRRPLVLGIPHCWALPYTKQWLYVIVSKSTSTLMKGVFLNMMSPLILSMRMDIGTTFDYVCMLFI